MDFVIPAPCPSEAFSEGGKAGIYRLFFLLINQKILYLAIDPAGRTSKFFLDLYSLPLDNTTRTFS